jgi:hypothetical protein
MVTPGTFIPAEALLPEEYSKLSLKEQGNYTLAWECHVRHRTGPGASFRATMSDRLSCFLCDTGRYKKDKDGLTQQKGKSQEFYLPKGMSLMVLDPDFSVSALGDVLEGIIPTGNNVLTIPASKYCGVPLGSRPQDAGGPLDMGGKQTTKKEKHTTQPEASRKRKPTKNPKSTIMKKPKFQTTHANADMAEATLANDFDDLRDFETLAREETGERHPAADEEDNDDYSPPNARPQDARGTTT